jgi:integrase
MSKPSTDNMDSGRQRAWLSQRELESLYESVSDDMEREIALKLMGESGLRSAEVLDMSMDHVRQMETEGSRYKLIVPNDKGNKRRETVISDTLHTKMQAYSQANQKDSEPLIDRTTRTLQNWVKNATGSFEAKEWTHVSCHNARRSWAKQLLESGASVPAVMQLGGWQDYKTFRDHYLGTLSDRAIAEETAAFFD